MPVKGNNINLYYFNPDTEEDIIFACGRTCSFTVEVGEKIVTNQGSAWYEESRPDTARWQIDIEGLVALDNYSYLFLLNAQQNRDIITVKFVVDNGTIGGLVIVSGLVWIKSLSLNGPNKEIATYTCSLKGTGAYSTAGTQVTPGGVVIEGTTISVLQWQASGDENSHAFTGGVGRTMVYGSRGGTVLSPLTYLGTNPTSDPNAGDWETATGTLRVPTTNPWFSGENNIILVQ